MICGYLIGCFGVCSVWNLFVIWWFCLIYVWCMIAAGKLGLLIVAFECSLV